MAARTGGWPWDFLEQPGPNYNDVLSDDEDEEESKHHSEDESSVTNDDSSVKKDSTLFHPISQPLWFQCTKALLSHRPTNGRSCRTGKYWMLIVWIVLCVTGLCLGWMSFINTSVDRESHRGTDAARAKRHIMKGFFSKEDSSMMNTGISHSRPSLFTSYVLFTCDGGSCLNPKTGNDTQITDPLLHLSNMSVWLKEELMEFNQSEFEENDDDGDDYQLVNISDYYSTLKMCHDYSNDEDELKSDCIRNAYQRYIGGDQHQSAIMLIQSYHRTSQQQRWKLIQFIKKSLKTIRQRWLNYDNSDDDDGSSAQGTIEVYFAGDLMFESEKEKESTNLSYQFLVIVPIMFALVCLFLWSPRMLLLSMISVLVCGSISMCVILVIEKLGLLRVSTMVPSMIIVILVCMVIMHSVFMLSQWIEIVPRFMTVTSTSPASTNEIVGYTTYDRVFDAVLSTLFLSGKSIVWSGMSVILVCLVLFCGVKTQWIQSLSLCLCLSMLLVIPVMLTLIPSVILCFPEFFCVSGLRGTVIVTYSSHAAMLDAPGSMAAGTVVSSQHSSRVVGAKPNQKSTYGSVSLSDEVPVISSSLNNSQYAHNQGSSAPGTNSAVIPSENSVEAYLKSKPRFTESQQRWIESTYRMSDYPKNACMVGFSLLILVPVMSLAFHLDIDYGSNNESFIPQNSQAMRIYKDYIRDDYSPGMVAPLTMMIRINTNEDSSDSIWDYQYMNDTSRILQRVMDENDMISFIHGPSVFHGSGRNMNNMNNVTFVHEMSEEKYQQQLYSSQLYHAMMDGQVSSDLKSSMFILNINHDLLLVRNGHNRNNRAKKRINQLRKSMENACDDDDYDEYDCRLYGTSVENADISEDSISEFNLEMIFTMVFMSVLIMLNYGIYAGLIQFFLMKVLLLMSLIWGLFVLIYQTHFFHRILSFIIIDLFHTNDNDHQSRYDHIHQPCNYLSFLIANTLLILISIQMDSMYFTLASQYTHHYAYLRHYSLIYAHLKSGPLISVFMTVIICFGFGITWYLLSEITIINQVGFILTFGVMIDHLLLRMLLVPSLLSLIYSDQMAYSQERSNLSSLNHKSHSYDHGIMYAVINQARASPPPPSSSKITHHPSKSLRKSSKNKQSLRSSAKRLSHE